LNIFTKIKSIFKPVIQNISNMMPRGFNRYGSGSKWPAGNSRGATIDIHNHFAIRQKVRNQMYDSVEGRALLTSIVDAVVDTGLKLKPTPIAEIIGKSPEELELWAEKTSMMYHLWSQSKKSHRSRINNGYQNQRLYQWFQQRDNDIFVRFHYGRDKDLINPLQIDFIDPNQVKGDAYTTTYIQSISQDGIIRDASGRETGYKIWNISKDGKYTEETIPAMGEKSGRIFMLHGYNPEYAGQGRGYSKMAHLIQELENLTDFKASVIQKAINQASFVAAVENDEQDASNFMEGRAAGPIQEYGITTEQTLNNETSETPIINWNTMNEATIRQPGSVLIGNLRRGDKLKYLQDTSPSAQYNTFVDAFFSSICASTGWAIELVLKKFNQNYSASRATLLLCWKTAQIERNEMIADFLDPQYEMWLSEEIAAGRIQCPGWSDKYIKTAWLNCEWAGSPMPNIDPQKSAQADKLYVELGAQTLDDVARNYNGSSGKANRAKNIRQYQETSEPPWGWKGGGSNQSSNTEQEEE
jgi:lambda family phage portal protein